MSYKIIKSNFVLVKSMQTLIVDDKGINLFIIMGVYVIKHIVRLFKAIACNILYDLFTSIMSFYMINFYETYKMTCYV